MMQVRVSMGLWAMLGLGLTGCTSLHHSTPDALVRYGMQRNLTQDNQYNFSGSYRLRVPAETEAVAAAHDADVAQQAAADTMAAQPAMDAETQPVSGADDAMTDAADAAARQRRVRFWSEAVSVPFSGAVDVPQRRAEMVPELRYETRNAVASIKLPVQADLGTWSVIVDPGAVAPFMDMVGLPKNIKLNKRYVKISLPERLYRDWPVQSILKAIPQAVDAGYASLNPAAYVWLPMDEDGHRVGARSRVGMRMTLADSQKMMAAMLDSMAIQLRAAQGQMPLSEAQQQKYQEAQTMLAALSSLNQDPSALVDSSGVSAEAVLKTAVQVDVYQDGRGRIVAMRESFPLRQWLGILGIEQPLDAVFWMQVDYTRPVFVIHSTPDNTQDISDLFFGAGPQNKAGEAADEHKPTSSTLQGLQDLTAQHRNIHIEVVD